MKVYGNLLGEFAKRGYTKTKIAESLGLSRKALSNKLECKTEFTIGEITKIQEEYLSDCQLSYLIETYDRPNKAS